MEVPEKIYLSYETDDEDGIFIDYMWHIHPFEGKNLKNVEYIRKDAFIEKACEFIFRRVFNCAEGSIIEDFKKYMEGE